MMTSSSPRRRPLSTLLRAGVLALVPIAALAACTNELDGGARQVIFVRQALAPPATTSAAGACVYDASPSAAALFEGAVDIDVRDQYNLTLLMQGSEDGLKTSITGAHVVVREGADTLADREVIANGFIEGGGLGIVSFIAIDPDTMIKLHGKPGLEKRTTYLSLVIEVEVMGRNPVGGGGASSGVFRFPVRACRGCLVSFVDGNDVLSPKQPNCEIPLAPTAHRPCAPGQDEPVPCQLCAGIPACESLP